MSNQDVPIDEVYMVPWYGVWRLIRHGQKVFIANCSKSGTIRIIYNNNVYINID